MEVNERREREEKMRDALLRLDLAAKMSKAIRDGYHPTQTSHNMANAIITHLRNQAFDLAKKAVID